MSAGNVVAFLRSPDLPPEFVVQIDGRPIWIVRVYEDGRMWWSDRCGCGKAFRSEENHREIIIGPYKGYGAAFHADDEQGKAAAALEAAKFEARAASLPHVPAGFSVVHFTETEGWQ